MGWPADSGVRASLGMIRAISQGPVSVWSFGGHPAYSMSMLIDSQMEFYFIVYKKNRQHQRLEHRMESMNPKTIHKVQPSVYLFSMIVSLSKSSPGRACTAMGLHIVDFSCFCPILKTSLIHESDLGFQLGSQRRKIIGLLLINGFSASLAEKRNLTTVQTWRVWGSKLL